MNDVIHEDSKKRLRKKEKKEESEMARALTLSTMDSHSQMMS